MEFFLGAFTSEWERRRAAFLHDRALGRSTGNDEDLRRRRGGAIPHRSVDIGGGGVSRGQGGARKRRLAPQPRSMAKRFAAIARGSQPAVVKMASFGGGARIGAMVSYVSRNGEVALENQSGEALQGRNGIAAISDDWAHLMGNRAESRDIGLFRIDVAGGPQGGEALHDWAREIVKSGVGDRSFAFAVEEREKTYRIEGAVVLRARSGERMTADAKATEIVQAQMAGQRRDDAEIRFRFAGYGNGVEYGTSRVRNLVAKFDGAVENDRGEQIADAKRAGDLVQLEWRGELHSRKPRDVMHLVMSARAGTDASAFRAAAREFLAAEFADHRYVFSLHDPTRDPKPEQEGGKRPHVHVHAIVAMRSDHGERIETTIASFRRWREGLAEHARAQGIRMEMTDRREQASAPAFTRNQVRPVSRAGRTEHEGTTDAASKRYNRKRRNNPTAARTEKSRDYTKTAHSHWSEIAGSADGVKVEAFVKKQISRLETAARRLWTERLESDRSSDFGSQFRTELVRLSEVAEVENMSAMTRSEFEAYEKGVETALFQAERVMPENERANFAEIAAAAREHVDVRRELMEQAEQAGDRTREDTGVRSGEDDVNRHREDADARYRLHSAEAANEIMREVEPYREKRDLADAGEFQTEKASLQASASFELARAAELGAAGNSYVGEIGEADEELRLAIEAAGRCRDRTRNKVDSVDERDVTGGAGVDMRRRDSLSGEVSERGDGIAPAGDTTRTDPARQHVPRLEELQYEAERDRDDYDR